jgi:uncharacterized membrane protein
LTYTVAVPPITDTFTEFYVLNSDGYPADYPQSLAVGEQVKVILGVVNQEHQTLSYSIGVKLNGTSNATAEPQILKQSGEWRETISFQPAVKGNNQKVEFQLFRSDLNEVYRSVYILINVN